MCITYIFPDRSYQIGKIKFCYNCNQSAKCTSFAKKKFCNYTIINVKEIIKKIDFEIICMYDIRVIHIPYAYIHIYYFKII